MAIKLKPREGEEKDRFGELVCHLLEGGLDISIGNDQTVISVWLEGDSMWSLALTKDGKWRLE